MKWPLNMNEQNDEELEFGTTDGYKTHLELPCCRLKYNGHETVYTAYMIS